MWEKLRSLYFNSFSQPRRTAEELIALNLPMDALLMLAGVASAASAIANVFIRGLLIANIPELDGSEAASPLMVAIFQFATIFVFAGLAASIGRLFGGKGGFAGALAISVWLSLVQLGLLLAAMLVAAILPPLALVMMMAVGGLSLWILASFVAALHGFKGVGLVLLGMLGIIFALSFVLVALGGGLQQP